MTPQAFGPAELRIAAFNARLTLLVHGTPADLELRPDPADPTVMARLRPGPPRPATRAERDLSAAIEHRHSSRQPFRPDPVPTDVRTHRGSQRP